MMRPSLCRAQANFAKLVLAVRLAMIWQPSSRILKKVRVMQRLYCPKSFIGAQKLPGQSGADYALPDEFGESAVTGTYLLIE